VAVLPDHPTPIRVKTHTHDLVPFVVRGKGKDTTETFSEKSAQNGMFGRKNAVDFLSFLFA
jgi:2,3-bisphosphoglycerate-independent phosphoglycerate mutase